MHHFCFLLVNYTTITVTFSFKRRLGYYLLQVYIPDVLIVLLSWIAFWLVPDSAGDRLTIGVTTILTVMFLSGAMNASMPPVSYAKAMDWYLMVSFAFVFLSVIESLVVYVVCSRPHMKKSEVNRMVESFHRTGLGPYWLLRVHNRVIQSRLFLRANSTTPSFFAPNPDPPNFVKYFF